MIFRRALVRLTVTYTVVQLALFAAFAVGVYLFVLGTFDFDAIQVDDDIAADAAEVGFATLRAGLETAFAILLVVAPITSYLMARTALTPIKRSYDQQRAFVDGASHELRTPLSVIRGELELALTKSRTPAQYRRAIETALDEVDSLTRLADDLLMLSDDTHPDLASTFEAVALNDLATSVRAEPHVADRRVALEFDLGEPTAVYGAPELLRRAVQNVVDNAVKYSADGATVTVRTSSASGMGVIEVRDEGAGMTAEETTRAFERFWRAESARSQRGHGLGLALVRHIFKAHQGEVTIVSQPGRGTTVTLAVPVHVPVRGE